MALELDSRYPGRFNPGDADYPQGSFKNRTAPGALDGSYLEKDWANDKEGFFQRLMLEAGISPNGDVDTALASQNYDALIQVIQDQNSIPADLLTSGIAGSFSNLKASATGTNATVTVTADSICLKNLSNEQVVINALALAINSATVGANGLDTGVLAASTWYAVWVIWNGTTAAGLLSLSATAPTLPVGYTHKARIGWARTDASGNKYPLNYIQRGNVFQYVVAAGSNVTRVPLMASGNQGSGSAASPTWAAIATGNFAPTTARSIIVTAGATNLSSGTGFLISPSNTRGGNTSTNPPSFGFDIGSGTLTQSTNQQGRLMLESANIYAWAFVSTFYICCEGFEDNL